ncbi:MAG: hydroxyacylglutathione hydrolase [Elusimicrobiota bacterium]
MKIIGISLLTDNYSWLLADEKSGDCAVVDPAESGPVLAYIEREELRLRWILTTHHHYDHIGGIQSLRRKFDAEVLCSTYDYAAGRVPGATRGLADNETFQAAGSEAVSLAVPGHTLGAAAFHFPRERAVFTGDTLFTAGCGRLFEGTPEQMHASLTRLKALPPETMVYCGHEYTDKNIRFAHGLLPEDSAVAARLERVESEISAGRATVPAPLAEELATNPFLRAEDAALQAATGKSGAVETFTEIRRRRDGF